MKRKEPGNSLDFLNLHQEARDVELTLDLEPKGDEKILCPKCGYDMTLKFEVWFIRKEIKKLREGIREIMENLEKEVKNGSKS